MQDKFWPSLYLSIGFALVQILHSFYVSKHYGKLRSILGGGKEHHYGYIGGIILGIIVFLLSYFYFFVYKTSLFFLFFSPLIGGIVIIIATEFILAQSYSTFFFELLILFVSIFIYIMSPQVMEEIMKILAPELRRGRIVSISLTFLSVIVAVAVGCASILSSISIIFIQEITLYSKHLLLYLSITVLYIVIGIYFGIYQLFFSISILS